MIKRFSELSIEARARVLAAVIHEETIHARAIRLENPADADGLSEKLELIHRVAGYSMGLPQKTHEDDASMLAMILECSGASEATLESWIEREHSCG